jgi:hypothetical protein
MRLILDLNDPRGREEEAVQVASDALRKAGFNPYRAKVTDEEQEGDG